MNRPDSPAPSRSPLPLPLRCLLAVLLPADDRRVVTHELVELYRLRLGRGDGSTDRRWLWRQVLQYPPRLFGERIRLAAERRRGIGLSSRHTHESEPMRNLWRDLRHSLRGLTRVPVLTLTIVSTVGLGIGATTVLSSVIHAVLIEPLPSPEPAQLVRIYYDRKPFRAPLSAAGYLALEEHQTSFQNVAGYTFTTVTFNRNETAERIAGKRVTTGYFDVLGVSPGLGRGFGELEAGPDAEPSAIVSHGFWLRHLGAAPNVVGAMIRLDGVEHRVVGVLPRDPGPLDYRSEIFIAARYAPPPRRGPFFIHIVARLRDGIAPAAAAREVRAINERIFPLWESTYQDNTTEWGLIDLKETVVGDVETRLFLSLAAVAFVLLIACANAANLLVARASQRRRELGIRGALGASPGRLLQFLLSESALLSAGAIVVGLGLTLSGLQLVTTVGASYLPRAHEVALNGSTIVILLATAAASSLLFGLLPSVLGIRARIDGSVAGTRSTSGGVGAKRLRQGLVVAQVAVATPLLISAGLLLASLDRLQKVDIGVESDNVLTAAVLLPARSYPQLDGVLSFWDRARKRIEAIPGVTAVGYSDGRPPGDTAMANNFYLEDDPTPPGQPDPAVPWVSASPGYFEAIGITLLRGRLLNDLDSEASTNALVVDEAWSKRFFPDSSALGKRFRQGGCDECPFATVVGIVSDVKYSGIGRPGEGTVYWPMADRPLDFQLEQITQRFRYIVIRTAVEPLSVLPAVRNVIHELDPALPLSRVATVDDLAAISLEQPRYLSILVSTFAVIALLLSVIGIYGVMSYFVLQHSKDIGIRLALGDRPSNVLRAIISRGLKVVSLGLVIGFIGALALTRYISSLLFEVQTTDLTTFAGVVTAVLAAALLSCLLPARKAAGVDPAVALRTE